MKVKQTLEPWGPATAIVLTDAQVESLGGGKRAPVTVTIRAKTVRLRLAVMGGRNLIENPETRAKRIAAMLDMLRG